MHKDTKKLKRIYRGFKHEGKSMKALFAHTTDEDLRHMYVMWLRRKSGK